MSFWEKLKKALTKTKKTSTTSSISKAKKDVKKTNANKNTASKLTKKAVNNVIAKDLSKGKSFSQTHVKAEKIKAKTKDTKAAKEKAIEDNPLGVRMHVDGKLETERAWAKDKKKWEKDANTNNALAKPKNYLEQLENASGNKRAYGKTTDKDKSMLQATGVTAAEKKKLEDKYTDHSVLSGFTERLRPENTTIGIVDEAISGHHYNSKEEDFTDIYGGKDPKLKRTGIGYNAGVMLGEGAKIAATGLGSAESKIAGKAIAKTAIKSKAKTFAAKRGADALTYAIPNAAQAYKYGDGDVKQTAKAFAKQEAMDMTLGGIVDGIGIAAKGKKAKDKAAKVALEPDVPEVKKISNKNSTKNTSKTKLKNQKAAKKIADKKIKEEKAKLTASQQKALERTIIDSKNNNTNIANKSVRGTISEPEEVSNLNSSTKTELLSKEPKAMTDKELLQAKEYATNSKVIPNKNKSKLATKKGAISDEELKYLENSQNGNTTTSVEPKKANWVKEDFTGKKTLREAIDNADSENYKGGAKLLQTQAKYDDTFTTKVSKNLKSLKSSLVDSFDSFEKVARKMGGEDGKNLLAQTNAARLAKARVVHNLTREQTNFAGNKVVGRSAKDIIDNIKSQSDTHYQDVQEYLYNRLNLESLNNGRSVFNGKVTGDIRDEKMSSYAIMKKLSEKNPNIVKDADEIVKYFNNLQQARVDSGLISKELKATLDDLYKSYVPTYRYLDGKLVSVEKGTKDGAKIGSGVYKAKGGQQSILSLEEQMTKATNQVFSDGETNRLLNMYQKATNAETLTLEDIKAKSDSFEQLNNDMGIVKAKGKFFATYYDKGKLKQVAIPEGAYKGLEDLRSKNFDQEEWLNTFLDKTTKATSVFKKLITAYSPFFMVRNAARDIQDAFLYSKDLSKFISSMPKAMTELKNQGEYYKMWERSGGKGGTFFDFMENTTNEKWIQRNPLKMMTSLNEFVEQMPRLTEYIATLDKGLNGAELKTASKDLLNNAAYNAAEITTNFGRSGTLGRKLNQSLIPFFNPSVQGGDKFIRELTGTKSAKAWGVLASKAAVLGIAPSVLNELILGDDEGYKTINERDRLTNYIIKLSDDTYMKIPKGRALSVYSMPFQSATMAMKDSGNGFAELISVTGDQIAPLNPLTSNIFAPAGFAALNKTWYGGQIVPEYLQDMPKGEQSNERTSIIAKAIGKKMNASPMKIDYILDAYTGIIGDVMLPLLDKDADRNFVAKQLTIDTVLQNNLGTNFYGNVDKYDTIANGSEATESDKAKAVYYDKQAAKMKSFNAAIRTINNSDVSQKEKYEQVRALSKYRNELMKNALNNEDKYDAFIKENKGLDSKEMYEKAEKELDFTSSVKDMQSLQKVIGPKITVQIVASDSDYAKGESYTKNGGSWDKFYKGYESIKKLKQDVTTTSSLTSAVALASVGADDKLLESFDCKDSKSKAYKYIKSGGTVEEMSKTYNQQRTNANKYNGSTVFKAISIAETGDKDRLYTLYGVESKKPLAKAVKKFNVSKKTLLNAYDNADTDGNKYYKKDELISYISKKGYTGVKASIIFRSLASWNAKNPYGEIEGYLASGKSSGSSYGSGRRKSSSKSSGKGRAGRDTSLDKYIGVSQAKTVFHKTAAYKQQNVERKNYLGELSGSNSKGLTLAQRKAIIKTYTNM